MASLPNLVASHECDRSQACRRIVFLHGLFGSPSHWSEIMHPLAESYEMVAPQLPIDRRGNRRLDGVHSVAELTEFVEQTLKSIGWSRCVLVGNSLGGLVAMDYALRHRDNVLGLVLAGSAGLHERSLTQGSKPRPTRDFVRSVVRDIFFDPCMVTEPLVDEWFELLQDRDYARFLLRLSRATRDRNVENELSSLTMPTMLLWGRQDLITPPDVAEQFRQRIPRSQLRYLDRCGHSPNLEQPQAFAEHLLEFLPSCFLSEHNVCASPM